MKDILSLYRMGPVAGHMLSDAQYTSGDIGVVNEVLIFGLELEIENFPRAQAAVLGFEYKADNSLRNNGKEAITYPTKAKHLQTLLESFFKAHKIKQDKHYTERCSTHVHMNVQDLTFDQIKAIALVYQTVERLLFQFVGNDREENIFCVPWHASGLTANFVPAISTAADKTVRDWYKYSALNLLPLLTLGSIEFRHMEGTCNVPRLMKWINLLSCIHRYALKTSFDALSKLVLEMNTVSNYDVYVHAVFGEHVDVIQNIPDYKSFLSMGITDTKLMLVAPEKQEGQHLNAEGLQDLLNEVRAQGQPYNDIWFDDPIAVPAPAIRLRQEVDIFGRIVQHNVPERERANYLANNWVEILPNVFREPGAGFGAPAFVRRGPR